MSETPFKTAAILCPASLPSSLSTAPDPASIRWSALVRALAQEDTAALEAALVPWLKAGVDPSRLEVEDIKSGQRATLPMVCLAMRRRRLPWSLSSIPVLAVWEAISPIDWAAQFAQSAQGSIGAPGMVASLLGASVAFCREEARKARDLSSDFSGDEPGTGRRPKAPPSNRFEEAFESWSGHLDWKAVDPSGRTPLHWVMASVPLAGLLPVVTALTDAGADWAARDQAGAAASDLYGQRPPGFADQDLHEELRIQIVGMALDRKVLSGVARGPARM